MINRRIPAVLAGLALLVGAGLSHAEPDNLQRAKNQIQAAYDVGQGKSAYLHWPSLWVVDERAVHYRRTIKAISLKGESALVTSFQDESVVAMDPKTGEKHFIRYTETFQDRWKHNRRGWFLKKSVQLNAAGMRDGNPPPGLRDIP